jgi:hypothetical protein
MNVVAAPRDGCLGDDQPVATPMNVQRALAFATILMLASCDAGDPGAQADESSSSGAVSASTPAVVPTASQAATPCVGARITFGPVHKSRILTAVAPVVTITAASGGRLDEVLRPVRRYRPEVVAEASAPQADIYQAFTDTFDDDALIAKLGEVAPAEPGVTTVQGRGRFVQYAGVQTAEATFSYSCGPLTDRGTVSTWFITATGVLSCDRKPQPTEPIHTEAIALSCPH